MHVQKGFGVALNIAALQLTPDYQSWGCDSEPDEKKDKSGS